jgi:hypothetical protein
VDRDSNLLHDLITAPVRSVSMRYSGNGGRIAGLDITDAF